MEDKAYPRREDGLLTIKGQILQLKDWEKEFADKEDYESAATCRDLIKKNEQEIKNQ